MNKIIFALIVFFQFLISFSYFKNIILSNQVDLVFFIKIVVFLISWVSLFLLCLNKNKLNKIYKLIVNFFLLVIYLSCMSLFIIPSINKDYSSNNDDGVFK
jgi:hypothetical protein